MIKKLLIANRGEIARRIVRTAKKMGIKAVAVYSDADRKALHVRDADEAVHIGASPATDSYLRIDKIIAAAKQTGADAIHPGYGFLSENADLPEACVKAGITFVGPRAEAMRALGGKAAAKDIAIKAGVPVVPGYQGKAQDVATLTKEAKRIGYPVMIKAVAGGGGRGMRLVEKEADLAELLDSARREAQSAFGNPDVLIEKVVVKPRHIEVQVFGDTHGNVVHLFERDCTLQRRNQKVIEEAPAPGMSDALRAKMCDAAVKLAKSVNYEGAGTVEFLVEGGELSEKAPWYFIEMNTRLQVEHPVTEEITGLDLVEWQLRVAAGEKLPLAQRDIKMSGHAIEVRLCAEDPAKGFMPSVGRIEVFNETNPLLPPNVRIERGVTQGDAISPFYDSMIAKFIVARPRRQDVLTDLTESLAAAPFGGITTNARFLINLLHHKGVRTARMDTGLIGRELAELSNDSIDSAAAQFGLELHAGHAQRYQTQDPWGRSDSFTLGAPVGQPALALVDGIARPHRLHWQIVSSHQSNEAEATALFENWAGMVSGTTPQWHGTHVNGTTYVFDRGRQIVISKPTYDTSAVEDAGDGSAIRAPINGRVAKLFAKAGDAIEKGQRIAVVEAMKMEHVLTAAASGTVDKIAVSEGAQVTQGSLIAAVKVA